MSEVSYARKYRPRNIGEYMGDEVRNIMKNRFSDIKNFPQVILLHGTRGTGKTSAARLIAKEYHCLNRVDGHACGECEMCKEIEDNLILSENGGQAIGVQEVDIASDNGKSNIEAILEDAIEEPMYPLKYKVIIMDEFHMATQSAQNRLLKITEEPPEHLVFIICTTNPEKVIETVISRCQLKIEVKKASIEDLVERLLYVCKQENITTSKEALKLVAKKADRVPREALMLLESIAKNHNYNVTLETVQKQTGDVASELYIDYYKAANDSLESILTFNKRLKEQNITYKNFIKGLIQFTLDCLYVKYAIELDYSIEFTRAVKELFKMYNTNELDTLLQIVEYAVKMIDSDDTKAELIVTTTAMRIGKLRLLSKGLSGQGAEAVKENKASIGAYKGLIKADEDEAKQSARGSFINDATMVSIFGSTVEEVGGAGNVIQEDYSVLSKSSETSETDDETFTNEDLLSIFSK